MGIAGKVSKCGLLKGYCKNQQGADDSLDQGRTGGDGTKRWEPGHLLKVGSTEFGMDMGYEKKGRSRMSPGSWAE